MNGNDPGATDPAARQIRLVIVDDSPAIVQAIRSVLELIPEVEIVGAFGTAEAALAFLDHEEPDLVLMDLRLPQMSGLEATRRLRKEHPRLRTIIVTGLDAEVRRICELAGADGFVVKRRLDRDLPREMKRVCRQAQTTTTMEC